MKHFILFFFSILMITFSFSNASAQIDVSNPSFEDGANSPVGWTFLTDSDGLFTWEDTISHTGNKSVSIVPPATCSWSVYEWHSSDFIPISPERNHVISVWHFWSELPATNESAEIGIDLYDINGASLGGHGCVLVDYRNPSPSWVGEWHQFFCDLPELDPGAAKIKISLSRVCRDATNTSAILYYDDVALHTEGSMSGRVSFEPTRLCDLTIEPPDTDCHYYTVTLDGSRGQAGGFSLISRNWQADGVYHIPELPADNYTVHFADILVDATGANIVYEEWYKNQTDMADANPVTVSLGGETTGIDAVLIPEVVASVDITAKSNGTPLVGAKTALAPGEGQRLVVAGLEDQVDKMTRKAINIHETVTVGQGDNLSIEIESFSGNTQGVPADWWLVVLTPFKAPKDWYHYDVKKDKWVPGFEVTHQGRSVSLPSKEVLNMTGLPPGTYTFYYAVDLVMDGEVDLSDSIFDSVSVTVMP